MECITMQEEYIPSRAIKVVTAKINLPETWSKQDRIAAIGLPICTHSEDLEQIPVTAITCPFSYDVIGLQNQVHVVVDNSENLETLKIPKGKLIAHAEFLEEQIPEEEIKRILETAESIQVDQDVGEIEKQSHKEIGRYDYISQVNIKSDDPDIQNFSKQLLIETEQFWSKHTFDIGKFDKKARITMKNTQPIRDKPRIISPRIQEEAQEIIEQLQKYNLITKGNSPYCSNPVFVRKKPPEKQGLQACAGELDETKKGKLRLVCDFRSINKSIESNCNYPIPSIKSIIHKLRQAKYVTMLDLSAGYWNLELTESSQPLFAFHCNNSMYKWLRMPMGVSVAQGIMAQAIDETIKEEGLMAFVQAYIDNILIISETLEDHKRDLKTALQAFIKRGWKAHPGKSHLFINDSCRLFGFHVDLKNNSVSADPKKVEKIQQIPPPTNHKAARAFAGSINYYNELLPNLAQLMTPIYNSIKQAQYKWTEECQKNFEIIKQELAKLPVIFMPDFNKPMHLFTDAAQGQFISYCVQQYHEKFKKFVPVTFNSHILTINECAYSQPEVELLACIYALKQESYLLGFSKTIWHTDCKSLTFLFKFSKYCSKLNRWQIIMNSFDIEVFFEKADSIGIILVDMLSRRPGMRRIVNRRPKKHEIENLPEIKLKNAARYSIPEIKKIIEKVLQQTPPPSQEAIKIIQENDEIDDITPENLSCNQLIIEKLRNQPINRQQEKTQMQQEHQMFKNDISPSGKLINLILSEAPGMSLNALRIHQMEDPVFGPIIQKMIQTQEAIMPYALKEGILLRQTEDHQAIMEYVVCVPKSLSQTLIEKMHQSIFSMHHDVKKLMINIKRRFYIKNLKKECQQVINQCKICAFNKAFSKKKQPFGNKIKVTGPRQLWALDICTVDSQAEKVDPKLPTAFLIAVDAWSLYTITIPIKSNPTAREIIQKFILHIVQPFGFPALGITTDNGSNFSNKLMSTFTAALNLQQFRISAFNAKANVAERLNRAILSGLRYAKLQFKLEPEVFKNLISYITLAWNTSVLTSVGYAPYRLFMSTEYTPAALTSFITVKEAENETYGDFVSALTKTQHIIENIVNEKYKELRDKRYKKRLENAENSIFKEGSLVMIKIQPDQTKRAHKLRPRFKGPYKIIREFQNNVEVIDWSDEKRPIFEDKYKNQASNIPKFEKYLVHKDRLKPCSEIAWYYDENLARKFYNLFWDNIREIQPIMEVTRNYTPQEALEEIPKNRPTSLILPARLGIKTNGKLGFNQREIKKKQQQEYESSSDDSESSDDEDNSRKPQNKMSPIEQVQTPEKRLEKSPSSSTNVSLEDDIPDMQDWIQIRVPGREIGIQDTSRVKTSRPRLVKPRKLEKWILNPELEGLEDSEIVTVSPEKEKSSTNKHQNPTERSYEEIEVTQKENMPKIAKSVKSTWSGNTRTSKRSKGRNTTKENSEKDEEIEIPDSTYHMAEEEFDTISQIYSEGGINKEFDTMAEILDNSFKQIDSEIETILSD